MKYQSIEEICKDFNLDSSLIEGNMIDELSKLQGGIKPDTNVAINFLRTKKNQTMVPASEVVDLVKGIFNNISIIDYEDKLSKRISKCSEKNVKKVKEYYFPKKISAVFITILIGIMSLFITLIVNNRLFSSDLIDYFYLILVMVWFAVLTVLLSYFIKIVKREFLIKSVLNNLDNTDLQFEIYKAFVNQRNKRESFRKKDLENFINEYIFKNYLGRFLDKNLYLSIKDIVPKVADLIIFRALNKNFIVIRNDVWNDEYTIVHDKCF